MTNTMKPRASYRRAVEWIAANDETRCMKADELADMVSVLLVADLWSKDPLTVARAVVRTRCRAIAASAGGE